MKAKIIFSLSLLIPFSLLFMYVWATATDLAFMEDIFFTKGGFVEHYLNGTLTFAHLWRPIDYCRTFGYNLLLLANIKLFSMNLKIFALLIPFFIMASACLIYKDYRKSLDGECSPEFIAATYFVLTLIIFNVIQWEALYYGNALSYQYSMPFFIASFISLELYLSKGTRKYLLASIILSAMYILVFSGRIIIVFVPVLGSTFLCYLLTSRSKLNKDFWLRALIISIFLTVIASLYLYGIQSNDFVTNPLFYAVDIFASPLESVRFLLVTFGASVIGVDAFYAYNYFSFHNIIVLGLIVVLLYTLALMLFFASRMYERTYLPFFLIMITLFYVTFMAFRKFGLGIDSGMISRYTHVTIYGLAALVWIFIFSLTRPIQPKLLLKGILWVSLMMILIGHLMTSIAVWKNQPYLEAYMDRVREITIRGDASMPEELSKIGWSPIEIKLFRDAMLVLHKHKLNVYRERSEENKN